MNLPMGEDETRRALEMLTHLYNSVEEGKAVITSFTLEQDKMEVTTLGSPWAMYKPTGMVHISLEADVWTPNK